MHMAHSCSHHHHAPTSFHKAFGIGITLNTIFVAVELVAGHYTGSLALIADAVHNLGDVLGLVLAWIGYYFAHKPPSDRYNFGLGRLSIFATVFNGAFLVVSAFWIVYEAFERWNDVPIQATGLVMITAGIGIVINMGTALALMRGQHDINIKGAFLHMLGDAGVSAAVILAAVLIYMTGMGWIDPALGILVAGFILWTSWPLLAEGLRLALDGVPANINHKEIKEFILKQESVQEVNDLRIWAISTNKTALSAHIVVKGAQTGPAILKSLHHALQHHYGLASVTLQLEDDHKSCITTD